MFLSDYIDAINMFKDYYGIYSVCIYSITCSPDGVYIIFSNDTGSSRYYYHIKNKTLRTEKQEKEFVVAENEKAEREAKVRYRLEEILQQAYEDDRCCDWWLQ